MRLAAKELLAVFASEPVRSLTSAIMLDEQGTMPDDVANESAFDDWLRANVTDYVHACGSCRMGPADDPLAVVDPACRVIGVEGLSVVDASVVPIIPRANTHLTTVMIAERAVSFLTA